MGRVKCVFWARFNVLIGPGPVYKERQGQTQGLHLSFLDLGQMWGLGQVYHMDWARLNRDIGSGAVYKLGQAECQDWTYLFWI